MIQEKFWNWSCNGKGKVLLVDMALQVSVYTLKQMSKISLFPRSTRSKAWTSRIRCCSEGKAEENGQEIAIDMATTKIKGKIVISKADADTEKLRWQRILHHPEETVKNRKQNQVKMTWVRDVSIVQRLVFLQYRLLMKKREYVPEFVRVL